MQKSRKTMRAKDRQAEALAPNDALWLSLCRMDARDAWAACAFLERTALGKLKATDPLARMFARWRSDDDLPEGLDTPDARLLRLTLWMFMQRPDDERAALLNGWRFWSPLDYDHNRQTRLVLDRSLYETGPVLRLCGWDDRVAADWIGGSLSPEGLYPVSLLIRAGSTRQQVLEQLDAMARMVREDWGRLPGIGGGLEL